VDEVFARMGVKAGQRLLEIGPGPHGGCGLIAALMGLRVVTVEYDQPFVVDVDRLRQQLTSIGGSEAALAQIAALGGSLPIAPIDSLRALVDRFRPLIDIARGSLEIVPGDFADAAVQQRVDTFGAFDHVICTDVIDPMHDAFNQTTAGFTTGDGGKVQVLVDGLARIGGRARTLYIGVIIPEQSDAFGQNIQAIYERLESGLRAGGKSVQYERVISPSSGTVVRSRLYHLVRAPQTPGVHTQLA
jgi:hypothetical protein